MPEDVVAKKVLQVRTGRGGSNQVAGVSGTMRCWMAFLGALRSRCCRASRERMKG